MKTQHPFASSRRHGTRVRSEHAPHHALQPEPVPGVTVRCGCGRVVRTRKNGNPVAHDYCIHAPATGS